MACVFAAYRATDSRRVVLVHSRAPTDTADTGFGAVQGTATVTPAGTIQPKTMTPALWLPDVIVADMPEGIPDAPATIHVTLFAGSSPCGSAALGAAGTVVPSDLLFAIAIPQ